MAKILVVDDEQVLVKGIKFNLEHEGYQVEVGYDGEQAVELAREGSFDLILLDLMMPKIDGLQACMRIREFSNVPVIMLTAKGEDADKLMGFESGADDYITKPFNPIEVIARVKSQLRRYTSLGGKQGGGEANPALLTNGGIALDEIGVEHLPGGAPAYRLTGTAQARLGELGAEHAFLSLTHEAGMAAAVCVIE